MSNVYYLQRVIFMHNNGHIQQVTYEHVTQNLCQSAVRKRLAKYVKYMYKASLFNLYFPPTHLLKQPGHAISREMTQNTRCDEVPFWGPHARWSTTFGGSNFPKRQKWPSIG